MRLFSTAVRQAVCTILGGAGCVPESPPEAEPYEDSGLADREIFDAECDTQWGDDPVREGDDGESGNEDVDDAFANLGRVHDYYADRFGHISLDGDGGTIRGVVNFCDPAGVRGGSSFWDGDQIKFAPGAADSLDTAAHELTHAVIDNTADLEYQCQSGALNEAIADMMAYNIDPEDSTYGENRDGGAIRDYSDRWHRADRLRRSPHQQRHPEPCVLRVGPACGPRPRRADPLEDVDREAGVRFRLRGLPRRDARVGTRALR